ncbi:cold-shock protein [Halopseudomonas salina]|uniref:Cold-shock protein n=1 Tax=Halopseudomonas salina TaxID=1323744 RepID=A0ABQ1NW91_9GAMM|nr:cold-shock protein [Halopseudomonas salina]GGC86317.1 cold-shock protein [Halopseudomonas salina]
MNTLRYLHLIIGLAALITGLVNTLPFFAQSGLINLNGILLLFTGLLNLQQFTARHRVDTAIRFGVAIVVSIGLLVAALIPLISTWVPALETLVIYAIGMAIGVVCLATVMTLANEIQQLSFSLPGRQSDREAGTVKWFNINKGFGFISRDQGDDVFVHFRAIRGEGHRALEEGQRVEFVVARREKGLQAEDVVIL